MLVELPDLLVRALFSRPVAYSASQASKASPLVDHGPFLHATVGIAGEAGELLDVAKKAWAYGHDFNKTHAVEELGDILFYWISACLILNVHPQTVIDQNVAKLKVRYLPRRRSPTKR